MRESKLLRRLGSLRLAAWLIAAYIAMNVISFFVPQRNQLNQAYAQFQAANPLLASISGALGLDHLYSSWVMLVVTTLLAINVAACTFLRLGRRNRAGRPAVGPDATSQTLGATWGTPESFLDVAEARVVSSGWSILHRDERGIVARAGAIGFWGSMLFHASLLVLILGGVATGLTTFKGRLVITEGQEVVDEARSYERIELLPRLGDQYTGARIALDSMDFGYQGDSVVSAVARMRYIDRSGRVGASDVKVNYPLEAAGRSYVLLRTGYAVDMAVGTDGAPAQERVVRLGDQAVDGWRDIYELPPIDGKPAQLQLRATPRPLARGERMPARQFEISDPRLYVVLVIDGKPVWRGELERGESLDAGNGVTVEFTDIAFWTFYRVTGEPMRWVTYAGFWLAVAGAAVRFAVPERRLALVINQTEGSATMQVQVRSRPWVGLAGEQDRALVALLAHTAAEGAGPEENEDEHGV